MKILLKTFGTLLLLLIAFLGYLTYQISFPHVIESSDWTSLKSARLKSSHLFKGFPEETRAIRYANSVVGLRGWCFAFVIDAPTADLHGFAESQLRPYSEGIVRTDSDSFPFNESTVDGLRNGYSVETSWLVESAPSIGSLYELANDFGPTIFVDGDAGMLYYLATD